MVCCWGLTTANHVSSKYFHLAVVLSPWSIVITGGNLLMFVFSTVLQKQLRIFSMIYTINKTMHTITPVKNACSTGLNLTDE